MNKIVALVLLLSTFFSACSSHEKLEPIAGLKFEQLNISADAAGGIESLTLHRVDLGNGHWVNTSIRIGHRGNGILILPDKKKGSLWIRIYDAHGENDPAYVYKNWMLDYRFEDLNKDGIRDLVITGERQCVEENGTVRFHEKINTIYRLSFDGISWRHVMGMKLDFNMDSGIRFKGEYSRPYSFLLADEYPPSVRVRPMRNWGWPGDCW